MNQPARHRRDFVMLIVALLLPTVVTLVYFQLLKDAVPSLQQTAYGLGKTLQFALPVIWIGLFHRHRLQELLPATWLLSSPNKMVHVADGAPSRMVNRLSGLVAATLFGVLVVFLLFGLYFLVLSGTEVGNSLQEQVIAKVTSLGIDTTWKFIALGVFYALIHSFLEEYYWRWFVYPMAKLFTSETVANMVSSFGFATHHVLLLGFFLGWDSPYTWIGSLAIAVGGSVWAWQYDRGGSLMVPWVSHMIVDAGIFSLGFWLVRDVL